MIALIVATHGEFSREIVKSAEMIFGKQENISSITFNPGEGPDDLQLKYQKALNELDSNDGTLFLVDLFGGSPFNAAALIAAENEKMDVITGINMPMLLECLDKRNYSSLIDLVESIRQTATEGVRTLKQSLTASSISEDGDL
ncbi:PTS sugar transporter subunit IIA [Bacillus sp. 03113]|uniref:PTS sugar transporter subunit IIA n=1 Tax=Bacillus sp. 03113 TaxID=2578211 RepID=UPI001141FD43|nr:PTS sugar transporter subunit IIA [Bacillus sp. 03113]